MHALIVSGSGRYADPWHPTHETAARIGEILEHDGWRTTLSRHADDALSDLSGVDLLVINTTDPWRNGETGTGAPEAARAELARAIADGIGILSMHAGVSSLRDYPSWPAAVGAVWLPTISGHPDIGLTTIRPLSAHRTDGLTDGLDAFEVFDERYCNLQFVGERTVLAEHEEAGERFPTAWVRAVEKARVAVDLLGHDLRSYESVGHVDLVRRLARWAGSASVE